jgi:hypothetical protein
LWALALAGSAAAATPCGTSGVFSQSGSAATCKYGGDGSAFTDTFSVPSGVSSVDVIAVGAAGGTGNCCTSNGLGGGASGGDGASVEDTAVSVSGGDDLTVTVGARGQDGSPTNGGAGGNPGGGNGGPGPYNGGGGGGGYSGVFRSSTALVIAGAGGGGGGWDEGLPGGAGGTPDASANTGGGSFGSGFNGGGGSTTNMKGGVFGAGVFGGGDGTSGGSLTGGPGGAGDTGHVTGGGGGGGYFGGGGGGGGSGGGGGGGGGSSFGISGLTNETATTAAASVTISYTASASALAATLVSDSTGKAPGTALADKATAIQTAVNASPPQTATACADITDYLGLVKAQTGKKLTTGPNGTAALLTTDANNLAASLGCT